MAKRQKPGEAIIKAAESTGRALGRVAGRFNKLKARSKKQTMGQEKFIALAEKAGARSGAVVKKAKAVAKKTRKAG